MKDDTRDKEGEEGRMQLVKGDGEGFRKKREGCRGGRKRGTQGREEGRGGTYKKWTRVYFFIVLN